ncbi:phage tail protein [Herbaspirillum sp. C7C2]|uniref:phage tail protein n=1 Tax=Herbaspirillum sp. C7C2 TaxID=2736666 RepID=UPI001F51E59F|nr:phage tail protein [Herbaspirillum sp. C7C2]MCI1015006.1 phage tail protein [Herbaspirillum sp. C7C2]
MKIFHYNHETGELLSSDIAREDPQLPGEFRLPAFATIDPPPGFINPACALAYLDGAGTVPADYRAGAWREVLDYRGLYWRTDTGQQEQFTRLGMTPQEAGLTDQEPPKFGKWNGHAWEVDQSAAKAAHNAAIAMQIVAIEQQEQPAAQRAFALNGDASALRVIQEKIDALQAQIQE